MKKNNMTGLFKEGDIIKTNENTPFHNEERALEVLYCDTNNLLAEGEKGTYVFNMREVNETKNFSNYFTLVRQAEKESSDSAEHGNNSTKLQGGEE